LLTGGLYLHPEDGGATNGRWQRGRVTSGMWQQREREGCATSGVYIGRIASITSENAPLELKRIDELIREALQLGRAIVTNMRNKDKALRQALSIVEALALDKGPTRDLEKEKDTAMDKPEELETIQKRDDEQ
jgi:DUF917 family protein